MQPPPTDTSDAISYTLYLDGAANGQDAGWSVIVVACHPEGESFIGCLLGTVQLGSAHPNWFGADTADNMAAELTAMVVAQNLAMRWEGNNSFCIRPDLSLSPNGSHYSHHMQVKSGTSQAVWRPGSMAGKQGHHTGNPRTQGPRME